MRLLVAVLQLLGVRTGLARHGIKLFTAEVVHDDHPVIPNSVPFQTDHVMWHKERALNLLAGCWLIPVAMSRGWTAIWCGQRTGITGRWSC